MVEEGEDHTKVWSMEMAISAKRKTATTLAMAFAKQTPPKITRHQEARADMKVGAKGFGWKSHCNVAYIYRFFV